MRLTVKMLDAMDTALAELLAGEGPQGMGEDEGQSVMDQAHKAQSWVWQELDRRRLKKRRYLRPGDYRP